MATAGSPWILSLSSEISTTRTETGDLLLGTHAGAWKFQGVSVALEQALLDGGTERELESLVGSPRLAWLLLVLSQLGQAGLLCRSLHGSSGRLATWMPVTPGVGFVERDLSAAKLSRFAFLRRKAGRTILESPLRSSRLILYDWRAVALLSAYPEDPGLLSEAQRQALLCLADNCGFFDGERDPSHWDFHSLLFHARSRAGRSRGPHGRFPVTTPSLIEQRQEETATHTLTPPTLNVAREPEFSRLLQERRSERGHGAKPITLKQLNEFLWRTAHESDGRRPYPNAGQVYELEVSLVIRRCEGLESGLYRYQPRSHGLLRMSSSGAVEALLVEAKAATGSTQLPQVLLLLSARFLKMNSRYRFIAYSNILKNVGVVMQTMALTASAMGLASCPLGSGDADLFCQAFGTDYAEESSVGELTLGSRPTESSESD